MTTPDEWPPVATPPQADLASEITAMRTIANRLEPFDHAARHRILAWLVSRYDFDPTDPM